MDFYGGYPDRLVTDLNGTIIAQTHGHLQQVNFGFQKLDLWGTRGKCRYLFVWAFTYSDAWMEGKTLFLNRFYQPTARCYQ